MGQYKFNLNESTSTKGAFNIYQARNGSIQLTMNLNSIELTKNQVKKLQISVYDLENFDYDTYKKHYKI